MARKPPAAIREGDILWLDIGVAATRLGTTRRKLGERALAGEFRYQEDAYGMPFRLAEADVAPARKAKLAADRAKAERQPRPKTARQLEAEWARRSADNARETSGRAPVTAHRLDILMSQPKGSKPD